MIPPHPRPLSHTARGEKGKGILLPSPLVGEGAGG
jgi:hypothetical protein